jgi:hypothetical protein
MRQHSRRIPFPRITTVAGGLFAVVLALSGCGGGSSEDPADSDAKASANESDAAEGTEEDSAGDDAGSPEEAVEAFYEEDAAAALWALSGGDFSTLTEIAERHFCSEYVAEFETLAEEMESMPDEQFGGHAEGMEEFTDIEMTILETTENGDTAIVEVEETRPNPYGEDMLTDTKTIDLAKEDGEWKLCGAFLMG